MTHRTSDYTQRLHAGGFRVTPQRQLILDAICQTGGHASPDDVYAWVHAKAPSINRATVYRNLDFLSGVHLITSTDMGQDGRVYEIACASPHHHLVCRACGEVIRIDHAMVKAFFAKIERECEFTVETDHLALFGLCRHCREK